MSEENIIQGCGKLQQHFYTGPFRLTSDMKFERAKRVDCNQADLPDCPSNYQGIRQIRLILKCWDLKEYYG